MDQIVAIMLLVGCSADGGTCTEIPVPTPSYASVEECRAELPLQMRFTSTYDERVVGACAEIETAVLDQSATIEWAVSRGGELHVEVVPAEPQEVAEAAGSQPADLQVALR